jgi:DNA-binding transcriptional regulator GbsR (MarR family)
MKTSSDENEAGAPTGPVESLSRARRIVGESIGDLMGFWNFKPSMGRVWTCLYLSPRPMTAAEIVAETGLSVGSVSMTLQDLREWAVVRDSGREGSRRCFEAETDVVRMVTHVFRERELRLVQKTVERLEEAVRLLDHQGRTSSASQMLESRFVVTRAQRLLDLSKAGHTLIDRFSRVGRFDIGAIRNKLSLRR